MSPKPRNPRQPQPASAMLLRGLVGLFLTGVGALLVYLRFFQLPAPTGPSPVGTTVLHFTDLSRTDPYSSNRSGHRELVVQLWYPAQLSTARPARYMRWREAGLNHFYAPLLRTHARSDAPIAQGGSPFPVLLFSHRWGGQRTQSTALAEDLASHGYVVASIDYPHNAARTQLADGTVIRGHEDIQGPKGSAATADEQIAFWNRTLQLWTADERFVLDQLAALSATPASPAEPFHARLDTARAGAFGHSFGGAAALALCGLDPRVKAAANLDGWTFGALQNRTAAQPILLAYEGISRDREKQLATLPQPGSTEDQLDRADFAATEESLRRFGGYRLFLAGTQHMDFSDEPLLPPFHRRGFTGPTQPEEVDAMLRTAVLQFFDSTLRAAPAPLLVAGQSRFPDLAVERWPAPPQTPPDAPDRPAHSTDGMPRK